MFYRLAILITVAVLSIGCNQVKIVAVSTPTATVTPRTTLEPTATTTAVATVTEVRENVTPLEDEDASTQKFVPLCPDNSYDATLMVGKSLGLDKKPTWDEKERIAMSNRLAQIDQETGKPHWQNVIANLKEKGSCR